MKFKKRLQIIFVFVLLLQQSLLAHVALPHFVLCFGEDGHVAVEWNESASSCDLENPSLNHLESTEKGCFENCGPACTDINLSNSHLSEARAQELQKIVFSTTIEFFDYFVEKHSSTCHKSKTDQLLPSFFTPEIIHTTILII